MLVTVDEAADLLGVGRSRIFDLMRSHRLLSVRIGRSRRIPLVSLREYVAQLSEDAWVA